MAQAYHATPAALVGIERQLGEWAAYQFNLAVMAVAAKRPKKRGK